MLEGEWCAAGVGEMEDDVLVGILDEVALRRGRWGRAVGGGGEGAYCFDRREEPEGGTLAGVESQLV